MGKETKTTSTEGMRCPITGCSIKKIILAWIAVFVTIFAYEWAFHGMYMMPDYEATASMWRDGAGMQELLHIAWIRQAVLAFVIGGLYCWVSKAEHGCCTKFGIKFGAMIGLILGISSFGLYLYLPIPYEMALKWLIGETLMGVVIGIVLAFMGKCCTKKV